MTFKIIPLMTKSLFRSRFRLIATTGCCLIAGLIISFSLMAEHSLGVGMQSSGEGLNLVMAEKDKY